MLLLSGGNSFHCLHLLLPMKGVLYRIGGMVKASSTDPLLLKKVNGPRVS